MSDDQKESIECDKCGACCKTFPIYASKDDAAVEPRILSETLELKEWVADPKWTYQLHPLPFQKGCCFLGENNLCKIYDRRPKVCREFKAGSEQCNAARARVGLPKFP